MHGFHVPFILIFFLLTTHICTHSWLYKQVVLVCTVELRSLKRGLLLYTVHNTQCLLWEYEVTVMNYKPVGRLEKEEGEEEGYKKAFFLLKKMFFFHGESIFDLARWHISIDIFVWYLFSRMKIYIKYLYLYSKSIGITYICECANAC